MATNRQIILERRPVSAVEAADFSGREVEMPPCPDGGILLRNTVLSIDPAIRQWIGGRGRYISPVNPGDVVRSVVLGEVIESRLEGFHAGDTVRALGHWAEYSPATRRDFPFLLPENDALPQTCHLGVTGNAGLAAYFGLFDIAKPNDGETILVSAAAGGVGSVVGQLAKEAGCHVVGLASSEEKRAWLVDSCGFDVALDSHAEDLRAQLKECCPEGIDIYFDNVGGRTLEIALSLLARRGRIVICGATSQYDSPVSELRGPANYLALLETGGTMQGFITSDYVKRFPEALDFLRARVLNGRIAYRETRLAGLEQAPGALISLFDGGAFGKVLVEL